MFTGLIRHIGKVRSFTGELLCIQSDLKPKIGDSIAVNGVCLTAIKSESGHFCVELSNHTRSFIAHENFSSLVHLEPAMSLQDRFDGHIVQGHVDFIANIQDIQKDDRAYNIWLKMPKEAMVFMVLKGSITIDGVSLTINEIKNDQIKLTIIPHTFDKTLFHTYTKNRRVNVESDLFARYIFHMLHPQKTSLSWEEVELMQSIF